MLLRILAVALGGAVGSALRYVLGLGLTAAAGEAWLPIPTLAVNALGSFGLGLLMAAWPEPTLPRLALTAGLLGGFTTYSAFNFETWELAQHGKIPLALGYAFVTLGVCFLAGTVGAWLGGGVPQSHR